MATRRHVREAFYSELETAAGGLVNASDISQEYPNEPEGLPTIVHNDNYRTIPMNRGQAPVATQTDTNGGTTALIYVELIEARFSLLIAAEDEQTKEDIYEAVRSHFHEFDTPIRDSTELHADVHDVDVGDANSQDSEQRDPPSRGDRLQVSVGFQRFYTRDTTPVEEVDLNADVDNDGTVDLTYTTT